MNPTFPQKIVIMAIVMVTTFVAFAIADSGTRTTPSTEESPGRIYVVGTGGQGHDADRISGRPEGQAVKIVTPGYNDSPGQIYVYGTAGHAATAQRRDEQRKGYSAIVYSQGCGKSPGEIYVSGTGSRRIDDRHKIGECS